MKFLLVLMSAMLISLSAYAAQESCEEMRKGPNGVEFVPIPCKEHPIPCSETWFDGKSTHSKSVPCKPGQQKTLEQVEREEQTVQKRKCGKDFKALRVGMTVDRFEECNEALSYVTDTVGKGGVVETYRSTFYFIHAQQGRVVSYTRRTQ